MLLCANAALEENKQKINELNVFPVPDGDTGTNMSLTIGTAAAELKKKSWASVGAAANANASALLRGARGNSGVILSLLFRGFGKALISFIERNYRSSHNALQVGTGDVPSTVDFYKHCGFALLHRVANFFIDNYDHVIIEDGRQLIDMVYLQKRIG